MPTNPPASQRAAEKWLPYVAEIPEFNQVQDKLREQLASIISSEFETLVNLGEALVKGGPRLVFDFEDKAFCADCGAPITENTTHETDCLWQAFSAELKRMREK